MPTRSWRWYYPWYAELISKSVPFLAYRDKIYEVRVSKNKLEGTNLTGDNHTHVILVDISFVPAIYWPMLDIMSPNSNEDVPAAMIEGKTGNDLMCLVHNLGGCFTGH